MRGQDSVVLGIFGSGEVCRECDLLGCKDLTRDTGAQGGSDVANILFIFRLRGFEVE